MTLDLMRRPAIVSDEDRQWAIDQKPATWDVDAPELDWGLHVAEQAERFEGHFGAERKPHAEWSGLWRRVWWPKADPSILHPSKAPHRPHPFVMRDDPRFLVALALLDAAERRVAERFGVVQFRPDDPRAKAISNPSGADQ
jgi:hypothetical protein